jgi:hypothetical protein
MLLARLRLNRLRSRDLELQPARLRLACPAITPATSVDTAAAGRAAPPVQRGRVIRADGLAALLTLAVEVGPVEAAVMPAAVPRQAEAVVVAATLLVAVAAVDIANYSK